MRLRRARGVRIDFSATAGRGCGRRRRRRDEPADDGDDDDDDWHGREITARSGWSRQLRAPPRPVDVVRRCSPATSYAHHGRVLLLYNRRRDNGDDTAAVVLCTSATGTATVGRQHHRVLPAVAAGAAGARRGRRVRVHMQSGPVHARTVLLRRRQVLRQRVQPLVPVVSDDDDDDDTSIFYTIVYA